MKPRTEFKTSMFYKDVLLVCDNGSVVMRNYPLKICAMDGCNNHLMPKKVRSGVKAGEWEKSYAFNLLDYCCNEHAYIVKGIRHAEHLKNRREGKPIEKKQKDVVKPLPLSVIKSVSPVNNWLYGVKSISA